jgi:hypothetical protein
MLTFVYSFVDRDMFMRFRGGGIGHSTRDATCLLEEDARRGDKPIPSYDESTGELLCDGNVDEEWLDSDSASDDDVESVHSGLSHRSLDAVPQDYNDTDVETDDE